MFELKLLAVLSISGAATFIENKDNLTAVELQLKGAPVGGSYPAHIHINTALESEGIAVTLASVKGDGGYSTITF
tara:strand:- start:48018 stop:48242 length:225 start_codon:yes stop_codon:yes gene_type:complete